MARVTIFKCDFCGAEKKETNHWWDVFIEEGAPSAGASHLEVHPFDPEAEDQHKIACGEKCVCIGVSRFLSLGRLTVEEVLE